MKKGLYLLVMVIMMSMLVACGATNEVANNEADEEIAEAVEINEVKGFPLHVIDATGDEVVIQERPELMITLVPSNTEILYALDALDRVIAVSDNDDFPVGIQDEKPSIGGMEFNVEQIIGHNPDLVLASGFSDQDGLEQIRNAGITVLVVQNANSFTELYDSISLIGKVIGDEEKAEEVIESMQTKIEEIKAIANEIVDTKTVWVEIWPAPDMYTTGNGTFMHEMLEFIGATNAAGNTEGWPKFTEEDAVVLNPDIIITTYGHVAGMENAVDDVLNRAAWQQVNAIVNKEVYNIEANIVERPGPRLIEGVEKLANLIYPEVYQP